MKKIVRIGFVMACVVGMVPFYAGAQTQGMSIKMPVRRIVKKYTAENALK